MPELRHKRMLLAVIVLATLLAGPIRIGLQVYREQRTIADFRSRGFWIVRQNEPRWLPLWVDDNIRAALGAEVVINPLGHKFTDRDLQKLAQLPSLTALDLSGASVTNSGLAHLKHLTNLEWLDLYGPQITDEGLAHLRSLHRLQHVKLYGTKATDQGISVLKAASPAVQISDDRSLYDWAVKQQQIAPDSAPFEPLWSTLVANP